MATDDTKAQQIGAETTQGQVTDEGRARMEALARHVAQKATDDAATTHAPMSDEQLAQIRQRADNATPGPWKALGGSIVTADDDETEVADWISHNDADVLFIATARHTIPALLAEVERLRVENAAMREIVEAVAEAGVGDEYGGGSWLMFAGYDAETVRTKARALLNQSPEE